MKHLGIILIVLLVLSMTPLALAKEQGKGKGLDMEFKDDANASKIQEQLNAPYMVKSEAQIKTLVQEKTQLMEQERELVKNKKDQDILKNQNRIRILVQVLKANGTEQVIGPQVSEMAQEFNNSVMATINAEQRIQKKSAIAKFFTGDDQEAVSIIEQELNETEQEFQDLEEFTESIEGTSSESATWKQVFEEAKQERERLRELVKTSKKNRGILGFLNRD